MSERARRSLGLAFLALFVALIAWVAASDIGEVPSADRTQQWRSFGIAAVLAGAVMSWYSWRKLTRPSFDTRLKFSSGSPLLIPLLGCAYLLSRVIARGTSSLIAAEGVVCGFFAGMFVVFGFDAVTNRLSKGRSWRTGEHDRQTGAHSSNTSSPT